MSCSLDTPTLKVNNILVDSKSYRYLWIFIPKCVPPSGFHMSMNSIQSKTWKLSTIYPWPCKSFHQNVSSSIIFPSSPQPPAITACHHIYHNSFLLGPQLLFHSSSTPLSEKVSNYKLDLFSKCLNNSNELSNNSKVSSLLLFSDRAPVALAFFRPRHATSSFPLQDLHIYFPLPGMLSSFFASWISITCS